MRVGPCAMALAFVVASCRSRGESAARPVTSFATAASEPRSSIQSVPPTPAEGCPALAEPARFGPGTVHLPRVEGNETWTYEGSPHRLPAGLRVAPGAALTVVPCTVVLVGAGQSIDIGPDAALVAMGERLRPIRLDADLASPGSGAWTGLRFDANARPTSRLTWLTIAHAGGDTLDQSDPACLHDAMPDLDLEHVSFDSCRGFALAIEQHGSLSREAAALAIHGSDATFRAALSLPGADASTRVPPGAFDDASAAPRSP